MAAMQMPIRICVCLCIGFPCQQGPSCTAKVWGAPENTEAIGSGTDDVQVPRKVGVGIHNDFLKLRRDYGLECKGSLCLSEVANPRLCSVENSRTPQNWSLAGTVKTSPC